MTTIGPPGTIALQMLTPQAQPSAQKSAASSNNLIAVNNGAQSSNDVVPLAGKQKLASAVFDASTPDVTQRKLDLFKRTGEKLGVREEDFDDFAAYSSALKDAVLQLKIAPNGDRIIRQVEKEIGLDKLGVSLDTVIDALTDLASGANRTLTDALKKQMTEHDEDRAGRKMRLQSDELGLYRVA